MVSIVEIQEITKIFPGVKALDKVSFDIRKGEVLALLGENGAGKSTMTKILAGVVRPDGGKILINGDPVKLDSAGDAAKAGIGVVFQELSLVESLSVAENIFIQNLPKRIGGMVDWKGLNRKTANLLSRFNLDVDPRTQVKNLSSGQKQMVEILKVVSMGSRIIILDEPTSSLTIAETSRLFDIIRSLKSQGLSIVYITHKLSELYEITDRIVIFRDGTYIDSLPTEEVDDRLLVRKMVGRDIDDLYASEAGEGKTFGSVLLSVENFGKEGYFRDVSFSLRRGEILGFAGLVGSGRTELAHTLIGKMMKDSGTTIIDGRTVEIRTPAAAHNLGLSYLTENRKSDGLYLGFSIDRNIVAPSLRRFSGPSGFLRWGKIRDFARESINRFSIATPSESKIVLELSGGNQQKCLLSMCLSTQPRIVILDEPTRGVDVGARNDIYREIRRLAAEGVGIMLISSDLPELIGLSDRIAVMSRGKMMGCIEKKDFSEEIIMSYAAGIPAEA